MRKEWVDPKEIFVHRELNNRELNQDYIGDLSQSMTDKGFLPEFPIDIFKSENIVNIQTELPFICACGAHRTIAAVNAKLDRVLVTIHDGREEAFIEMMHLDNFKFDPAQHSGIGQPFTQKEKRAAVTQLLLLPKYFEQTNTALQDELRIPESSIRRWRKEVVDLLETESPKLQLWGISDGRLARLRELAKSSERIDSEGKTVKVRQPLAEATDSEKKEFYEQMEEDSWIAAEKHGFDWNHICTYMQRLWNTEAGGKWYLYRELSMQQLQKVHHLILSEDEAFIKEIVKIARTEEQVRVQRDKLNKAADLTIDNFKKIFARKEDKYSQEYRDLKKRFTTFVKNSDPKFNPFELEYYDYDHKDRDDPEFCEKQSELHHSILRDLTGEAEWLQEFRENETKRMQTLRENAMKRWEKNRTAAVEAVEVYPRNIDTGRLLSVGDRVVGMSRGILPKIAEMEAPSTHKFTSSISEEADLFKKLAYALNNDVEWVQEIPESKPLVDVSVGGGEDADVEDDDPLDNLPLGDIFEHIQSRFPDDIVHTVNPEKLEEARRDVLSSLGGVMYGDLDIQFWLLADIGKWLSQIKSEKSKSK